MVHILGQSDNIVNSIAAVLGEFEKSHDDAECTLYRYNPAAIRIKIVGSIFSGRSKSDRHDYAMNYLNQLPDDVLAEISILLCLEPGERPFLDIEFEDPTPSKL